VPLGHKRYERRSRVGCCFDHQLEDPDGHLLNGWVKRTKNQDFSELSEMKQFNASG
jgi:hypothetical protein